MQLSLNVTGANSLTRGLNEMGARVADLRPVLNEITDDFFGVTEMEVFETQGASIGRRWKPNVEWWAEFKAEEKGWTPAMGVLVQGPPPGGKLRRALTTVSRGKVPYQIRDIDEANARFGTSFGFAAQLQKGATLTRRNRRTGATLSIRIPPRRFVRLNQQDRRRWTLKVDQYIIEGNTRPDRFLGM
jgi:hypothetical protein